MARFYVTAWAALILTVAGCAAIQKGVLGLISNDLTVAIERGEAQLGANDPLVVCFKTLDKLAKANLEAEKFDNGLLLDAVMRARVVEQARKGADAAIQASCSQIALEVMMQAARRGR